jgi:hypothetical protein
MVAVQRCGAGGAGCRPKAKLISEYGYGPVQPRLDLQIERAEKQNRLILRKKSWGIRNYLGEEQG